MTFWGAYRSSLGPARRVRCVPNGGAPHTFLAREPDQLAFALEERAPSALVPREFTVSSVARTLARLAQGVSYRSASLSARLEAGVPGSSSWSLSARWCQGLAEQVGELLLPGVWPDQAAAVPLALPDASAVLVVVIDVPSLRPVRARVFPVESMEQVARSIPTMLSGAPATLYACPQVASAFGPLVHRRVSSVGWLEWATLEGLTNEQATLVASVMQGESIPAAAAQELAASLGVAPSSADDTMRSAASLAWPLRDRLLRRGGSFRNLERTNALLTLFVLDSWGLATPEALTAALMRVWSPPSPSQEKSLGSLLTPTG